MKLRRNRELLRIALAAVLAMLVAPALAQASTTVGQVASVRESQAAPNPL